MVEVDWTVTAAPTLELIEQRADKWAPSAQPPSFQPQARIPRLESGISLSVSPLDHASNDVLFPAVATANCKIRGGA